MKFATIGTSWITESFIKAVRHTGKAELLSVYSRSNETAETFARNNGAEKYFLDLDAMLEQTIDFLYVASPNILHYEHVLKAIKKNIHVFCEKPLVLNDTQWEEVHTLANKNNVFVFEGYRHLYSPNYQMLKEVLGTIGPIRSGLLQYIQYSSRYDSFKEGKEPNVFSKKFAGGALMDLGVYPLSMAIDLWGEPNDISYFPVLLSNGIDGSGTLVLTYEGFVITILCSKIAQATIPSEIHGEEGTLTVDHIAPIRKITLHNHRMKEIKEYAEEQYELDMIYEAEAFIRMIEENDKQYYESAMERSRRVAYWLKRARDKQGTLLFPGE